jgi:hypothetical protein
VGGQSDGDPVVARCCVGQDDQLGIRELCHDVPRGTTACAVTSTTPRWLRASDEVHTVALSAALVESTLAKRFRALAPPSGCARLRSNSSASPPVAAMAMNRALWWRGLRLRLEPRRGRGYRPRRCGLRLWRADRGRLRPCELR